MKKLLAILSFILGSSFLIPLVANPVSPQTAKTVAANFYSQYSTTGIQQPTFTIAYTEYAKDGQPVYYVFNINSNNGFVIVSAEDAAHPILGYSDRGQCNIPYNNNIAWWLNCRKEEIIVGRNQKMTATSDIADEWTSFITPQSSTHNSQVHRLTSVNPLLQSTWNQSPYYNAMCPGGSVTGCVATAMAQIMRYWSYPPHGHGYNAYIQEQADGFWGNFGYMEADYDTSHYVWSAMPYNLSGNNNQVAQLMLDCGISVDMDYSPSGSAAWVITGDYPICSQNSYVKYFGYNAATIQGLYKSNYTLANWTTIIENELYYSRPVQYVGNDSLANSGHTWVCDGYNNSSPVMFHMNWGWGGGSNGYFLLSAMDVAGYHFDWWDEAVIGIEPPATSAYFSGFPTFGCGNITVKFNDSSVANFPITSYKWLFPGGSPSSSTSASQSVVYNTPGTYDVTEIVSNINGTDTMVRKAYISVASDENLPLRQGFESNTFPPAGWVIYNPNGFSYTWQLDTTVGGYGRSKHSMYFNNTQIVADYYTIYTGLWVNPPGKPAIDIIGQRQQIYSPEYNFTGINNPEIYFDIAYAPYNSTFSDSLAVYYSTDCGATFHRVYLKGGMTLGTTGNTVKTGADTNWNGIFVPLANNWRTDTIHIPSIAQVSNVMFSFENRSGNGAAMYIDNVTIPGITTGISKSSVGSGQLSVYPNPSKDIFTFQTSNISDEYSVEIYNVLGEQIFSQLNIFNSTFNIDLSSQPSGVYFYKAVNKTGNIMGEGKLVIQK